MCCNFFLSLKVNKRTRYEQSNSIELENQPPRANIKRRSLFLCHPRQDWNNLQIENQIPSSYNPLLPSLSTFHRMNNMPYHEYEQNHFSPCDLHTEHRTNQDLYMFGRDSLMTSAQKSKYQINTSTIFSSNLIDKIVYRLT